MKENKENKVKESKIMDVSQYFFYIKINIQDVILEKIRCRKLGIRRKICRKNQKKMGKISEKRKNSLKLFKL